MHLADGLVVGEIGPVCVAIWRDEVDLPRFEMQAGALAVVTGKHPGKSAFVCIVEATCAAPDEDLRKRSVALVKQHEARLACVAAVIEGTGFRAAITRSVLSGMARLLPSRGRARRGFFANVRAAGTWVSELVDVDAVSFELAVEEWRASLAPPKSIA
jgi:hypothetical protein